MKALILIMLCLAPLGYVYPCSLHACSNDIDFFYGDEAVTWDHVWEARECGGLDPNIPCYPQIDRRCYQVGILNGGEEVVALAKVNCESSGWAAATEEYPAHWSYTPPSNFFYPYQTNNGTFGYPFPQEGIEYKYKVRACIGFQCGPWSTSLQFYGGEFACFDSTYGACETECYPNSQKRLPGMPDCEEE